MDNALKLRFIKECILLHQKNSAQNLHPDDLPEPKTEGKLYTNCSDKLPLADHLSFLSCLTKPKNIIEILIEPESLISFVHKGSPAASFTLIGQSASDIKNAEYDLLTEANHGPLISTLEKEHSINVRKIINDPTTVLPKMTQNFYDQVLISGIDANIDTYISQSLELMRPGGILLVFGIFSAARPHDPTQRDEISTTLRNTIKAIYKNALLKPSMLLEAEGLLQILKL